MASLKEIRSRIHSIQNIQKITRTMEMVAASQLRKAQAKAEQTRPYSAKIKDLLNNLATSDLLHPLMNQRPVHKTLVIIVSSDRGLCGSYNTNLFNKADRFLKKLDEELKSDHEEADILAIGRKGADYYRPKPWLLRQTITDLDKISYHEISTLAHLLINDFVAEKYDAVWLIYTHYINIMSRKIIVEKLLPLESNFAHEGQRTMDRLLEPSETALFEALLPRYCISKLHAILNEARASELSARIFSMKTATNNAEEMTERLTLERNKIRQASITREIAEISNGAANIT